jgi:predicted metal-dependent phosphoesterase TrpH/energy-coupling factor transporter ATP-binding protein EcfA2
MQYQNKGNRWFKCDFHLHTTASKCFQDKEVTPDQWVDKAIEMGLNCVAITDHNTAAGISAIQEAAKDKNLTIFPAVEITCGDSGIHLLVLFETNKTSKDVEKFLSKCEIDEAKFGKQDAQSPKTVIGIVEIANELNALVIPAHIDEYNGLNKFNHNALEDFYKKYAYVNAVHVVHQEFLNSKIEIEQITAYLNSYYKNEEPTTKLDGSTINLWHKAVKLALQHKKTILTFSDNPHSEDNKKRHGLLGIGCRHTWIKMAETPTLESLRQAFLLPESRVRNCFESQNFPYKQPDLWIKSIKVENTRITSQHAPLKVEFNPQLNTIVGGRGSGKSSILKFIRGAFNRISNLHDLNELKKDHESFYKLHDSKKDKDGVLFKNTVVEMCFMRHGVDYKITVSHETEKQNVKIEFLNGEGEWQENNDNGFIELFEFEHFSQKQIYEIAKKPNALRDIIDNAIEGMNNLKDKKEEIRRKFLEKCAHIRTLEQKTFQQEKLSVQFNDNASRLQLHNRKYGFLKRRNLFLDDKNKLDEFKRHILSNKSVIEKALNNFSVPSLPSLSNDNNDEFKSISTSATDKLQMVKKQMESLITHIDTIGTDYTMQVNTSIWNELKEECECEIAEMVLTDSEMNDIRQFESLFQETGQIQQQLIQIDKIKQSLSSERDEKKRLADEYMNVLREITQSRKIFVEEVLKGKNVRIKINDFRDRTNFEQQLRNVLDRDTSFESDIEHLVSLCFTKGKVEDNMMIFRNSILKLQHGESIDNISGHFKKLVLNLNPAQLDELEILMPEDEIKVEYKPAGSNSFKSLSTASDGQKTTAILTFILSHGQTPLILDQPEDDLDNKLIYELIVESLKKVKESRQLIIVTHNANIPVNADAECVISMDSTSDKIKVLKTDSVDSPEIQKEICAIMEGGKKAFQMRSERYKNLK